VLSTLRPYREMASTRTPRESVTREGDDPGEVRVRAPRSGPVAPQCRMRIARAVGRWAAALTSPDLRPGQLTDDTCPSSCAPRITVAHSAARRPTTYLGHGPAPPGKPQDRWVLNSTGSRSLTSSPRSQQALLAETHRSMPSGDDSRSRMIATRDTRDPPHPRRCQALRRADLSLLAWLLSSCQWRSDKAVVTDWHANDVAQMAQSGQAYSRRRSPGMGCRVENRVLC
jgi:hypothetical protein